MPPRLGLPAELDDLLLYRMARLRATAGGRGVRLCVGRVGITRREGRLPVIRARRFLE